MFVLLLFVSTAMAVKVMFTQPSEDIVCGSTHSLTWTYDDPAALEATEQLKIELWHDRRFPLSNTKIATLDTINRGSKTSTTFFWRVPDTIPLLWQSRFGDDDQDRASYIIIRDSKSNEILNKQFSYSSFIIKCCLDPCPEHTRCVEEEHKCQAYPKGTFMGSCGIITKCKPSETFECVDGYCAYINPPAMTTSMPTPPPCPAGTLGCRCLQNPLLAVNYYCSNSLTCDANGLCQKAQPIDDPDCPAGTEGCPCKSDFCDLDLFCLDSPAGVQAPRLCSPHAGCLNCPCKPPPFISCDDSLHCGQSGRCISDGICKKGTEGCKCDNGNCEAPFVCFKPPFTAICGKTRCLNCPCDENNECGKDLACLNSNVCRPKGEAPVIPGDGTDGECELGEKGCDCDGNGLCGNQALLKCINGKCVDNPNPSCDQVTCPCRDIDRCPQGLICVQGVCGDGRSSQNDKADEKSNEEQGNKGDDGAQQPNTPQTPGNDKDANKDVEITEKPFYETTIGMVAIGAGGLIVICFCLAMMICLCCCLFASKDDSYVANNPSYHTNNSTAMQPTF